MDYSKRLRALPVEAVATQAKVHTETAWKRLHPKPRGNTEASGTHNLYQ